MKITMKAARVNAGVPQQEIAKALGVTPGAVSQWESGKAKISAENFAKYCELIGTDPKNIFLPNTIR